MNSSLGVYIKLIDVIPHWSECGADTFVPFKSEPKYEEISVTKDAPKNGATQSFTFTSSLSSVSYAGIKTITTQNLGGAYGNRHVVYGITTSLNGKNFTVAINGQSELQATRETVTIFFVG